MTHKIKSMLKWGKEGLKVRKKLKTSFMDSPSISSKNNQLTWIVSKFVLCGVFFFQVLFVKIILKMMWLRTDYFFFPLHQHLHHREPLLKDYYSQINLDKLARFNNFFVFEIWYFVIKIVLTYCEKKLF